MSLTFKREITHPLDRFIISVRTMGLSRKIDFLTKLVRKGYITVDGRWDESWADNYIEQLTSILTQLDIAFKDNWDVHIFRQDVFNPDYDYDAYLESLDEDEEDEYDVDEYLLDDNGNHVQRLGLKPFVHYKNITISNSREQEEKIEDLMIAIPLHRNTNFNEFHFTFNRLQGARYDFSLEHFKAGYIHSHLVSRILKNIDFTKNGTLSDFCLGGDSETTDLLIEMEANGYDEGLFGLFVSMFDTIASWESLEGTPHEYINKIIKTKRKEVSLSRDDMKTMYDKLYIFLSNKVQSENLNIDLNYVFNQGRYRVKQDSKLEDVIRLFTREYRNGSYKEYLLVKEEENRFYGYTFDTDNSNDYIERFISRYGKIPYTYVAGRKVELRIRKSKIEIPNELEYIIHPKFKNYVAEQFENELYENAVTSSAIARQNQGVHA